MNGPVLNVNSQILLRLPSLEQRRVENIYPSDSGQEFDARIIDDRLYRLNEIVKDPKNPGKKPIIPICASAFWKGIPKIYPPGRKLSARVTVWSGRDIRRVVEGTYVPEKVA